MGYTLKIGQRTEGWAQDARDDNAPAFDEPTDYTNERWPSYTAWAEFCDESGLKSLFYGEGGLLASHPGIVPLTDEHKKAIDAVGSLSGHNQVRLEWLQYWVTWALENCSDPVFCNS